MSNPLESTEPLTIPASELRYNDRIGPWRVVSDPTVRDGQVIVDTARGEQAFAPDETVTVYR